MTTGGKVIEGVFARARSLNDDGAARLRADAERSIRERDARDQSERQARAQEIRRATLLSWGVPQKDVERIMAGRVEDWEPIRDVRAFAQARRSWSFEVGDSPKTIMVLGGAKGQGKTTAGGYFLADPAAKWPRQPYAPRFMTVAQLLRTNRYDAAQMAALERCPALVIDDLGSEYLDDKGAFLAFFFGLVNARYADWLDTVITCNLSRDKFRERYGERAYDRLREVGEYFEYEGESKRGVRP